MYPAASLKDLKDLTQTIGSGSPLPISPLRLLSRPVRAPTVRVVAIRQRVLDIAVLERTKHKPLGTEHDWRRHTTSTSPAAQTHGRTEIRTPRINPQVAANGSAPSHPHTPTAANQAAQPRSPPDTHTLARHGHSHD